ncbi:MAG: DUF1553 domain-containing protein [Gemmataceae bacterium]
MTSPKNPFFAKATANRIWERLFGRGIVSPADDFRDDNPPSHPELLDYLAETLIAADFDLRFLIRAPRRDRSVSTLQRPHAPKPG